MWLIREVENVESAVNPNQIKTELKVEVKKESLKDLHMVHDNSKQITKLTEGEENRKLKEERYFEEVHAEMGIDFVTSKAFDKEYLKSIKRIPKKCSKSKLNQKEKRRSVTSKKYSKAPEPAVEPEVAEATPEPVAELAHTGEKPHSCRYCLKSFTESGNLKRHEMVHTGEKPHSCQYCSEQFRRKEFLKAHERIHTDEQPFSCEVCQKSFFRADSLKMHKLIHTFIHANIAQNSSVKNTL